MRNICMLTTQPFAQLKELEALRARLNTNVSFPERVGSISAGVALLIYGLLRRSIGGLFLGLVGGALIHRGSTGHCAIYEKLGVNSRPTTPEAGVRGDKGIKVVKTVTVSRPRQYHPPAGALGAAVAKIFGEAPEQQLDEDLHRFKELLEAGIGR
jgi:uncharacterized membrane protein